MLHALRRALRRWGAFLVVAALAAGAGSSDPLGAAAALPATIAWPLHRALHALPGSAAGLVVWVLASAAAGLVPLLLTRRWWWPPRWAETERALPLGAAERARSDAEVVGWLLLPWHAGSAVGLALVNFGGVAFTVAAWSAWAVALAVSLAAGQAWLRRVRRGARRARPLVPPVPFAPAPARGAWRTWWWLPLRRGAAAGTARLLLGFGIANPALAAGPAVAPDATGWWLAGLSLAALAGTSLLRARIAVEWAGWRQAARAWPLRAARLEAQARLLAIAPVLAGLSLLLVLAALGLGPTLRPAVAATYALGLPLACWLEAQAPAADPSHQAARWLFLAALLVALGSEVAR